MRKGTGWPAARARWTTPYPGWRDYRFPVWAIPQWYGVYTFFVGPLPVPISIVPSDFDMGCWRYVPSRGTIRWEGDWDATAVWGRWAVEMKPWNDPYGWYRYGMTFTDASLGTDSFLSGFDTAGSNLPNALYTPWGGEFNVIFGSFPDPPREMTCSGQIQANYHDLYVAGIDKDDTSPVTWAAPDDPW